MDFGNKHNLTTLAQITAQIGFGLLIIAALAGFMGNGWFSSTRTTRAAYTLEYEKVIRAGKTQIIKLSNIQEPVAITLNSEANIQITEVRPENAAIIEAAGVITIRPREDGSDISIFYSTSNNLPARVAVKVIAGDVFNFNQLSLP